MTKKLSELTPEAAARQRASAQAYRQRNAAKIKEVESARHKRKYATDPAYRARKDTQANNARLKKLYGITPKGRDTLLAGQGGVCAICGTNYPGGRGWHIDHCHKSGKVRGILCTGCNVFIGRIESRPDVHQKALAYIAKHS